MWTCLLSGFRVDRPLKEDGWMVCKHRKYCVFVYMSLFDLFLSFGAPGKDFAHSGGTGTLIYHLNHSHNLFDPKKKDNPATSSTRRDASGRSISTPVTSLEGWATR